MLAIFVLLPSFNLSPLPSFFHLFLPLTPRLHSYSPLRTRLFSLVLICSLQSVLADADVDTLNLLGAGKREGRGERNGVLMHGMGGSMEGEGRGREDSYNRLALHLQHVSSNISPSYFLSPTLSAKIPYPPCPPPILHTPFPLTHSISHTPNLLPPLPLPLPP